MTSEDSAQCLIFLTVFLLCLSVRVWSSDGSLSDPALVDKLSTQESWSRKESLSSADDTPPSEEFPVTSERVEGSEWASRRG